MDGDPGEGGEVEVGEEVIGTDGNLRRECMDYGSVMQRKGENGFN